MIDLIEQHVNMFALSGSLQDHHLVWVQELKEEMLLELDPHALVLCEGPQFDDELVMSALGHSNGKPYENLYNWATKYGRMNHLPNRVHPGIEKYHHEYRKQKL